MDIGFDNDIGLKAIVDHLRNDPEFNKKAMKYRKMTLTKFLRSNKTLKDTHKYGATPGCRACTEILLGRGGRKASQYAIAHNEDCRARMTEEMRRDPIDAERLTRAEGRMMKHEQEKELH